MDMRRVLVGIAMLTVVSVTVAEDRAVSGIGEIVIFKPQTDAKGRSAVRMQKKANGFIVEFAPAIHIHRNFYAGDKNFQGPVVQGGRTIVVARHPRTKEPVYVDLNLPGGAPRIHHSKSSITYVYRDRRVSIHFHRNKSKTTTVKISSGRGFFRRSKELHAKIVHGVHNELKKSHTLSALQDLSKKGRETTAGVVGFVDQGIGQLLSGLSQVTSFLPGGPQAEGMANDLPQLRQQATEKAATRPGFFQFFK